MLRGGKENTFKESHPDPSDASDTVNGVSAAWRKRQGFPDGEGRSAGLKGKGSGGVEGTPKSSGSGSSGSGSSGSGSATGSGSGGGGGGGGGTGIGSHIMDLFL